MQTIIYNFIDKAKWLKGEWQEEPDKVQWQDEKTKLPCIAVRHRTLGHWCGYVGADKSNKLYGHSFGFEFSEPLGELSVHGGVTHTGTCSEDEHGVCHIVEKGEDDDIWWIGFDCAHLYDYSPNMNDKPIGDEVYKNLDYVKQECRDLAEQIAKCQ